MSLKEYITWKKEIIAYGIFIVLFLCLLWYVLDVAFHYRVWPVKAIFILLLDISCFFCGIIYPCYLLIKYFSLLKNISFEADHLIINNKKYYYDRIKRIKITDYTVTCNRLLPQERFIWLRLKGKNKKIWLGSETMIPFNIYVSLHDYVKDECEKNNIQFKEHEHRSILAT